MKPAAKCTKSVNPGVYMSAAHQQAGSGITDADCNWETMELLEGLCLDFLSFLINTITPLNWHRLHGGLQKANQRLAMSSRYIFLFSVCIRQWHR